MQAAVLAANVSQRTEMCRRQRRDMGSRFPRAQSAEPACARLCLSVAAAEKTSRPRTKYEPRGAADVRNQKVGFSGGVLAVLAVFL